MRETRIWLKKQELLEEKTENVRNKYECTTSRW